MKNILITGGAGFLGSHLAKRLINHGNFINVIDNFYTGNFENISEIINHPYFRFFDHNIINSFDNILKQIGHIDEIYNMACPASPPKYQKDPIFTLKTSVIGALNVLEVALKFNSKILQASTSEIYGDPFEHPQSEKYWGNVNPIGIRSCYDEGKRCAETLFFDYHREKKVKIKIARIFNTYGPFMDINDGRVISNFIVQSLKNQPITVYGEGDQTRSFCYVDDLINGLISLMDTDTDIIGPINLGNPNEFTIIELAKILLEMTKSSSIIIHNKLPEDDPKQRRPNISSAKSFLNWTPQINLQNGLEKTITYFKEKII